MKISLFLAVMPCSLVENDRGNICLHGEHMRAKLFVASVNGVTSMMLVIFIFEGFLLLFFLIRVEPNVVLTTVYDMCMLER